jgi:hypothetical protein
MYSIQRENSDCRQLVEHLDSDIVQGWLCMSGGEARQVAGTDRSIEGLP